MAELARSILNPSSFIGAHLSEIVAALPMTSQPLNDSDKAFVRIASALLHLPEETILEDLCAQSAGRLRGQIRHGFQAPSRQSKRRESQKAHAAAK